MKDEDLLHGLRDAARRRDAEPTGTPLDAPLGAAFEDDVVARLGRVGKPRSASRPRVVYLAPVVAALAAAATILLMLRRAPPAGDVALPTYALAVAGGVDEERGTSPATTGPVTAHAQSPVTLLLRPDTEVSDALAVRVFGSRDGKVREVAPDVRTSPTGSVEVRGRLGDLVGEAPGVATIVVIVARRGMRFEPDALVTGGAHAPAGIVVERVEARVVP